MNTYRGFALFNDIEDEELRTRNRAVVLCNMYEDSAKNGRVAPAAAAQVLGYYSNIPEGERKSVKERFVKEMLLRGYKL